ncbi:MAG TPA: hypothetical protein VIN10_13500 [Bacteroidales bacterium]
MKRKDFALRIAGSIFGLVSLLHLLRLITGASVVIADWPLPLFVNIFGFLAAAALCVWLWWLSLKKA